MIQAPIARLVPATEPPESNIKQTSVSQAHSLPPSLDAPVAAGPWPTCAAETAVQPTATEDEDESEDESDGYDRVKRDMVKLTFEVRPFSFFPCCCGSTWHSKVIVAAAVGFARIDDGHGSPAARCFCTRCCNTSTSPSSFVGLDKCAINPLFSLTKVPSPTVCVHVCECMAFWTSLHAFISDIPPQYAPCDVPYSAPMLLGC